MVEWKTLNDLCLKITDGSHFSPQSVEEGFYMPSVKDMTSKGFDYSSCKKISEDDYLSLIKTGCKPKINDVLVAKDGSMLKYVFPVSKEENIVVLSSIAILTPKTDVIDSRYLSFYLLRSDVKEQTIREFSSKGGVPRIILKNFKKIRIPIPSLSEQKRIVGILDTFTSAIDNLKEQIAQRRKQYEYYRNQLLDLEGKPGVEMKTLGAIGEFIRGNGIQKSDFVEDGYSCIHYGQIHAKYGFSATETLSKIEKSLYDKCKKAKKGDVVLATTSEDVEGVAKPFVWLGDEDAAVSGDAFIYHHNQIGKFMGFQFQTHKFMQFKVKYATGAKVVRISGDNMAKFEVALPSLSEQQRIVSILDTFEASIQNLEAQLSQREKQYEYYRNKLLSFE